MSQFTRSEMAQKLEAPPAWARAWSRASSIASAAPTSASASTAASTARERDAGGGTLDAGRGIWPLGRDSVRDLGTGGW